MDQPKAPPVDSEDATAAASTKNDSFENPTDPAASSTAGDSELAASSESKLAMGKAPKRRNIRHVLSPEEIGMEALEERRREQERQQRVNMMLASRMYNQQPQFGYQFQHHQPFQLSYLSDKEKAEISAREAVWRNFKQSTSCFEDGEVVLVSSDDEDDGNDAKRRKTASDDADSDSDCVCLGSDVEDENSSAAGASCSTADEAAVASHTKDEFNVPDAEGRVLINVGHAESEADIFLPQHLVNVIKPHQIGGLRFMYDNVVESVQRFRPEGGFGCVLAHSMGLGKTFQVVSFTDIVYRHTPIKRILIIVPVNTLQNWLQEFELWLPKSSFHKDIPPRQFDVAVIGEACKNWVSRIAVINDWYKRTGVLIVGYEMFRAVTNKISGVKSKKSNKLGLKNAQDVCNGEADLNFEDVAKALVDPGPDLIVCDEGHRIKNFQSHTSKALSSVKTKRRIVLTGYPLQNNLMEYWCMVNFVRPNYLGTRKEFANVFERPIRNGQCVDSTENDIKVMRFRVHVLTNLLKGFVQRRGYTLLSSTLPPKREFVLFVRKSPIQHRLYRRFVIECSADIRQDVGSWNPLKAFAVCCKIWNHPDVLYKAVRDHVDAVDGDLDLDFLGRHSTTVEDSSNGNAQGAVLCQPLSGGLCPFRQKKDDKKHIDYRWAEDLFVNYKPGVLQHGMKMRLAMSIVEHSVQMKDKILLFSQSLLTLDAVESFLNASVVPGTDQRWKKNRDYLRLDGSTNSIERQRLIARFNNERSVHLFLISTRAGSLGINLVSANRVIVFDASFNPCHDAQAVCRVYRYGQKKPAYIYRLISDNSMEKMIFNRQLGKQGIADRVVDERAVDAAVCREDLYDLLQYNEEEDMRTEECPIDEEKLEDELLVEICRQHNDCLTKEPISHESLMLDRGDQQLSEAEKREAKRGYEREKKMMKYGGSNSGSGNSIDWKRWQPDNRGREPMLADAFRQSRYWTEPEPPSIRPTPLPMMLQARPTLPQIVNGFVPVSSLLHGQQQQVHTSTFTASPYGAYASSMPPRDPELITLSDDEG